MSSILNHTLPGGDLYKLDSRRILEAQWDLIDASLDDSTSPQALRAAPHAVDVYPTLDALLVPLNAYFSVLTLHGLARGQPTMLPYYFFRYSSHLVKIATQYEWSAVLRYHLAFYARRCREMRTGEYAGWGKVEVDLMEQFLVPHQKNVKVASSCCTPIAMYIVLIQCILLHSLVKMAGRNECRPTTVCHAQNRLQMCGSVLDIIQYSLLTRPILQIPILRKTCSRRLMGKQIAWFMRVRGDWCYLRLLYSLVQHSID